MLRNEEILPLNKLCAQERRTLRRTRSHQLSIFSDPFYRSLPVAIEGFHAFPICRYSSLGSNPGWQRIVVHVQIRVLDHHPGIAPRIAWQRLWDIMRNHLILVNKRTVSVYLFSQVLCQISIAHISLIDNHAKLTLH